MNLGEGEKVKWRGDGEMTSSLVRDGTDDVIRERNRGDGEEKD